MQIAQAQFDGYPRLMALRLITRIIGFVLLAIPFLPVYLIERPPYRKPNLISAEYISPEIWLIGLLSLVAISGILARLLRVYAPKLDTFFGFIYRSFEKSALFTGLIVMSGMLLLIGSICFHFRPHIVDSIAQVFQVNVFRSGELAAQLPENFEFFYMQNIVPHDGLLSAQYPPGHSFFLLIGDLLGSVWIVSFVCSIASLVFLFFATRNYFGNKVAAISTVLLCCSPLYLMLGASFMNHVTTCVFLSAFIWAFSEWDKKGGNSYLYIAAIFTTLAILSRPLTTFAVGVVFAGFCLPKLFRSKNFAPIVVVPLISTFAVVVWGYFNSQTTGGAFVPGYIRNWGESHNLGFHQSPWGESFLLIDAVYNQLLNIVFFNLYVFENVWPATFPIGLWFFFSGSKTREEWLYICGLVALPVAYFCYWHTDFFLGPRFLYSSLLFFIPLTAKSIVWLYSCAKQRGEVLKVPLTLLLNMSVVLSLVYYVAIGLPHRLILYSEGLMSMKIDLSEMLEEKEIDKALVFVKVSWGNRVISELRGMGINSGLTERAYRKVGLCELDYWLRLRKGTGRTLEELQSELQIVIDGSKPMPKYPINNDPTSKFRIPIQLSESCIDEVMYDQMDYTLYSPHFIVNDPSFAGDIIVARDLREENKILMDRHSNHPVYYMAENRLFSKEEYQKRLQELRSGATFEQVKTYQDLRMEKAFEIIAE